MGSLWGIWSDGSVREESGGASLEGEIRSGVSGREESVEGSLQESSLE